MPSTVVMRDKAQGTKGMVFSGHSLGHSLENGP